MKTSDSIALECKLFTHGFIIFRITENIEIRVQIHKSYTKSWESNGLIESQAPLQQVCHQHESMGEWRRRNERIGR